MVINALRDLFFWGFVLVGLATTIAVRAEVASVSIPNNIVVQDVPALPASVGARLNRYASTRSASVYGWQGERLLIATRFGDSTQMHRVSAPLGYREQLTFLPEPLGGVALPQAGAGDTVILSWDVGGSEFDQLFVYNLEDGRRRMVSDGESLYAYVLFAPDERRFAYVTTERNGRNWDIHIQDMRGNKTVALETDQGFWFPLGWSGDGKHLLVKHRVSINESSVHELNLGDGTLTPLLGREGGVSIGTAAYGAGNTVAFTSDAGAAFLQLRALDLSSGEVSVLNADLEWDVQGFAFTPQRDKLIYVVNEGGFSRLNMIAWPSGETLPLPEIPSGIVGSLAFSGDGQRLAFSLNQPTSPSDVFVADLADQTVTRWTQSEVGGLDISRFVDAELIEYPTFDGRSIPAFLYKPEGDGPFPVVVSIHGGPEAQYRPYFSTTVQSYVREMGVAVIAPNVRGSNGYGKDYLKLDNGRLREDSVRDIGALLDWIETQADLRADRVAVMGGSYGGYMVLASMVHFGERLVAAVESVGISSFVTFLENTQPYRQDMRRVEYGDERDPDMRAHLEQISPLNHVDKMTTPLLIVQGANDPRVPASESEQIKTALDAAGVPVWYILAKDEGHGFRKKVNQDYDRVARFRFLEQHLTRE
ncbi:MAG: S9 family peptidase [Pseudomonadota bacterium]